MWQKHYSEFLSKSQFPLHFAAHSHHFWPDVTLEAQIKYWKDSSHYSDKKWEYFFSEVVPQTQKHLSQFLGIENPARWIFAPNTHEFVMRLISCLQADKKTNKEIHVLTTDSEFYSFDRQIQRTSENENWKVEMIAAEPHHNFHERLNAKLADHSFDLIFLSHVFFNSGVGWKIERSVESLKQQANQNAIVAIDNYHSFGAIPMNWKKFEKWAFLIGGSYKYLQGGEGACFMSVPDQANHWRPEYTGWFSLLGNLASVNSGEVPYSNDCFRYAGSTFDFSALYRLRSVLELFEKENLSMSVIHEYVFNLQSYFIDLLDQYQSQLKTEFQHLHRKNLILTEPQTQGHFLTFNLPTVEDTQKLSDCLKAKGILIDSRKNRLRFGFGLYQTKEMIDQVFTQLKK